MRDLAMLAGASSCSIIRAAHGEKTLNSVDTVVSSTLDAALADAPATQEDTVIYTRVPYDYVLQALRCCNNGHVYITRAPVFATMDAAKFEKEWFSIANYKFTNTDVAILVPAGTKILHMNDYCKSFGDAAVVLNSGLPLLFLGCERKKKLSKKKTYTFLIRVVESYADDQ